MLLIELLMTAVGWLIVAHFCMYLGRVKPAHCVYISRVGQTSSL